MADEKPVKVILLSDRLDRPGGGAYAADLASSLRELGHEVFLILTDLPGAAPAFEVPARLYRHLSAWTSGGSMRKFLVGEMQAFAPALVHAAQPRLGSPAREIARTLGLATLVTVHPTGGREWLPIDLEGSWVIVTSESLRGDLARRLGIPEDDIAVVPPGVRVRPGQLPEPMVSGRTPVVGTLGPLEDVEGQRFVLQAARRLLDRGLEIQVLIAGAGAEKSGLRRLAAELGLDDSATFTEDVLRPREVIEVMDVFVLPTTRDALSPMLLEALALGKPVVAAAAGDNLAAAQDGRTALTFPKGDVEALAAAVERLLLKPDFAAGLAREGRELVRREFSLDRMAQKTLHVYRSLAGRPPARGGASQTSQKTR